MLDKKSPSEIKILQTGGHKLAAVLHKVADSAKPGITGLELDALAEQLIIKAGGQPSFKNYNGFPNSLCVSVNDTIVHGIPNSIPLKEGDIVGLDLGMRYKGFYTDMAVTVGVGRISAEAEKLLYATKKSLDVAISQVKPGNYISDIGRAIEEFIKPYGYGIVRDLSGHGVGREVHEEPTIPNFNPSRQIAQMFPGLVIAIEPMIIMGGNHKVVTSDNRWDVKSHDESLTAHFEHTVAVTDKGVLIITQ